MVVALTELNHRVHLGAGLAYTGDVSEAPPLETVVSVTPRVSISPGAGRPAGLDPPLVVQRGWSSVYFWVSNAGVWIVDAVV